MRSESDFHVPVVKNTFIEIMKPSTAFARRVSLPGSSKLCREDDRVQRTCSDLSTNASTSGSSCDSDEWTMGSMPSMESSAVSDVPTHRRASAKAMVACKPMHKARMDRVIRQVAKILEASDKVSKVDVVDASLVVQVNGEGDLLTQEVSSLAQKTLLDVTTQSKFIYAMGFAANPFKIYANGFEVTLGAMENAKRACWHVFKKGVCRHGASCCKQHAVLEESLQVVIKVAPANIH